MITFSPNSTQEKPAAQVWRWEGPRSCAATYWSAQYTALEPTTRDPMTVAKRAVPSLGSS